VEVVVLAAAGAGAALCAHPDTDTASISAPSGSRALSEDEAEAAGAARGAKLLVPALRFFLLRAVFAARADGCAKMASKQGPACGRRTGFRKKLGWPEITEKGRELAGSKRSLEVYLK